MSLVSVIVPCFNQAAFLPDALQSVLNQTHKEWECIIINDGSTDNTEAIALRWCETDKRFRYVKKDNGGLSSARNAGLENALGNYIQFLDADDMIDGKKFSLSLDNLIECDLVISNFLQCNQNISNIVPSFCQLNAVTFNYENILLEWDKSFCIPIHCGFYKRKLFNNFKFREDLKAKEDWLMWLNIFKNEPRVKFIDQQLAIYRIQTKSMTRVPSIMNENTFKVFQVVMESMNDEKLLQLFFVKVNEYWNQKTNWYQDKLNESENKIHEKLTSNKPGFRLWLKKPLHFLKKIFNG